MDCRESRCDSRNDNKADCHEKSSDFSRNDGISVDYHTSPYGSFTMTKTPRRHCE